MFQDDMVFEDEVRRIARLLWPAAAFGGRGKEGGRERDGIFVTEEMVHLLECTKSRRLDKAQQDISKLIALARVMRSRYPRKGVKSWFVTLEEPTADQRTVAQQHRDEVVALSFEQFRSLIIDATSYLQLRLRYPFGSMQDPETGSKTATKDYIQRDMATKHGEVRTTGRVTAELVSGQKFILVGDYGAGKSTTLREVFVELGRQFSGHQSAKFPVHLNLRDHYGQTNPAEALERHARNVGYEQPHHLVRAWLAGSVILLLDGFDEFATAGWAGQAKKLRDIRYRSMQLIREFVRNTTRDSGVIIAGRAHFFDSEKESVTSLGVGSDVTQLALHDFTDVQIREYLQKKGWSEAIPAWLPSRPLLLGYLSAKGLLEHVLQVNVGSSPAAGWDELLERTSHREAEIEAGIDGDTVRQLVEHLATKARRRNDGMGPLSPQEILEGFQQVCGYPPDDRGIILLQRLPALGATSQEDGSREFIDRDFVDAARAGDILRFIENPHSFEIEGPSDWQVTMGQLGREVAALKCHKNGFNAGKLRTAVEIAGRSGESNVLCADLIQVTKEMGLGYSGKRLLVRDVMLQDASFGDGLEDFSKVTFRDCLFQRLEVGTEIEPSLLPRFVGCYIGTLEGRVSEADLPEGVFDKQCVFDAFGESAATTSAILGLPLAIGVRVLLTVLKKLYLQSGSGRKQSALFRGLDHRARRVVPEILDLLVQEKLAIKSSVGEETVWLPARSETVRVLRLVSAPTDNKDPIIENAANIQ